jgi:uncharacterized protein
MWLTAIILGITSSLHCVGMCSPLMLAVTNVKAHALINRLLYNSGRIFSYGILGMLVASVGAVLPIQYQNIVSLVLGAAMILIAALQLNITQVNFLAKVTAPVTSFLKNQFSFLLQKKKNLSFFSLGAVNGLLPCGMTAIALANCLALAGPVDGFNFMILFGVGTLPAMLGFASMLVTLVRNLKLNFQKITVTLIGLSGVLLIVRVFLHAGAEAHHTGKPLVDIVLCR